MTYSWVYEGMSSQITVQPEVPVVSGAKLRELNFKIDTYKHLTPSKMVRLDDSVKENLMAKARYLCDGGKILRTVYTTGNRAKVLVLCN